MKKQDLLLEKISNHIRCLDETPLFGNATPLNLEDLSAALGSQLGMENLTVRVKRGKWNEKEERVKKNVTSFTLSPIDEPFFWMMSKSDITRLTSLLFSNSKKKIPASQSLQDGFYRYLLLEAISVASTLQPLEQMSLSLDNIEKFPEGLSYCFDVEISSSEITVYGKFVIPNSFRKNWIQHFSAFPPRYNPTKLTQILPVEIGIQIGFVQIELNEWGKIRVGDVIVPDILSNDRMGTLMLDQISLFQVHLHEHQIELIDYALNIEDKMEDSEIPPINSLSQKLETFENETRSIKEIPLHISVEIARLKIPLDQLMSLSPGNLIELPSLSDKKVSLIANGQKIAVAELVQLGDTLGLKILDI